MLIGLIALQGVLVYASIVPDAVYPGAGRHSEHSQMHVAGASAHYDAEQTIPGAVAGVLMISIFVLALLLGAGRNGARTDFILTIVICSCLLLGSFLMLVITCEDYVQNPSPRLAGGLPVPSAWMVYGVWLTPVSFLAVYIAGFRRWVMTADDRKKLQALVTERSLTTPSSLPAK